MAEGAASDSPVESPVEPARRGGPADARPRSERSRALGWGRRHRADLLLAVVVLLVVLPVMQPLMAHQVSRYALTAALWDHGTVRIDAYADLVSVDRAERDGHLYSDKAPGQPVWALPAYGLYRLASGHPAAEARTFADVGLWVVSLWSAALPAVALAVVMRRFALRVAGSRAATAAALSLALGTMLLPFATQLFGHVLAALCALGAYLLATRPDASRWRLVAAGVVAGAGVAVEYPLGAFVVVLAVAAFVRQRWRAGWLVAGLAPPAILTAAYHWVAFGGPLRVGYQFGQFAIHSGGLVGVRTPAWDMTLRVLAGERGVLLLTPVVLVGLVGCVLLAARRAHRPQRLDAVVSLATFGVFLFVMGGWDNPTAGASPGPRYLVPALPFLVTGVALAWQRVPWLAAAAAVVGAVIMGAATFTLPLIPRTEVAAAEWATRLAEGRFADTILTQATGATWTLLVPVGLAAGGAVILFGWATRASEGTG